MSAADTHPDTEAPDKALTPRQREVLRALVAYVLRHQRMPTIRELLALIGVTATNGVMCHLDALVRKGYLRRTNESRGMTLPGVRIRMDYADDEHGARLKSALGKETLA